MIVYKYQAPDTALNHTIGSRTLRFSPPDVLNDPFECGPDPGSVFLNALTPEVKVLVDYVKGPGLDLDLAQRLMTEKLMRISFQKAFGQIAGILSLSKRPDDLIMWAHYAQNHGGFVIGFDGNHSFFSPTSGVSRDGLRDVIYRDDRPVPMGPLANSKPEDLLDMREVTDAFYFTKSSHWAHEQEVRAIRMVESGGQAAGIVEYPPDLVREIVIGARTSEADLEQAFRLRDSNFSHAAMKVAVLNVQTYAMTVEPAPPMQFMKLARHRKVS